jgi:hypothetical protein
LRGFHFSGFWIFSMEIRSELEHLGNVWFILSFAYLFVCLWTSLEI